MSDNLIDRLARLRGIGDAYHDYRGELRYFSRETKTDILRAMGCTVDDPSALAIELGQLEIDRWGTLLPPIAAANGKRIGVDLNVSARDFGAALVWTVILERGEKRSGVISTADCPEIWRGEVEGSWITRRRFELPLELPPGYHELEVKIGLGSVSRCLVILSPPECYEPAAIRQGRRLWGVAVQLYTVRSQDNWGIGDFSDLHALIRWLAARGAGFIGLNPLHALAPADPQRASPYSASNRHFLNLLYISVPAVPEFQECQAACARVAEPQFADRLSELRAASHVDYHGVAEIKFEIFELLFRDFRDRHLAQGTARAAAFRSFVAAGGPLLELHARFDALDQYFRATRGTASGWLSWPAEYHAADGAAALAFAAEHPLQVEFYLYLQWLAHEQLTAAQRLTRELGMPIGLYGDYAVGAHPSGSETWADQTGYRMGAEIGAPPDPLALKGQGWGTPPPDPVVMQAQHLQGFISLIRDSMRYYGALRLDHVMSLFRLWWVAAGHSPIEGAYVHYPLHLLLTALTLESVRSACVVVGEDLGVVPDEMRRAMPEFGLYHYKVLLFEKLDGRFRRPDEFVQRALATATTHDLPTLRSYWEGRDIELRRRLKVYPSVEVEEEVERERERDRVSLLAALTEQGLNPPHPDSPQEPFTPEFAQAVHVYLARSKTALVALQIEDLLGMVDPVNVPSTNHEYPNWQRKLTVDVEDIVARSDFDAYFAEIARARG
ncbi:MAG TPA: 4-alpha-glucanotransferase [Steroidobacteraceae bacterium]|nr:4-alpha-glucanotransferase [Steroidobacteraceae bacterium]